MTSTDEGLDGRFYPEESDVRRVTVLDSATHAGRHARSLKPGVSDIVINASYAGVYCAKLLLATQPAGVIGIDCGIGKDGAGIAGLHFFEALGIPAAAADIDTVELGNGRDLYENGIISRVNDSARVRGLRPGMSVRDAGHLLLEAPEFLSPPDLENRLVVADGPEGRKVVCTNSIADALPEDKLRNVLCTAGHTGRSVVEYILGFEPYGFICSDGGGGKNHSGTSALPIANAAGIPGASVSAASARMGDGQSTYFDGIISAVNELAAQAGVKIGDTAIVAAQLLVEKGRH